MSPDPLGVLVFWHFRNSLYLLTYLLTYLKVINPHNSGTAAAIVTKLRRLNERPPGAEIPQLGRNTSISNTTSGPVDQSSTLKRLCHVWRTGTFKLVHVTGQGVPLRAGCNEGCGMFELFFLIYLFNFLWKAISACCEAAVRPAESGLSLP